MKSADLAAVTQLADKPEFIDKERTALAITRQLVLDFGGLVEDPTGFCELEALAGKDDPELIRDMQRMFLPRRFSRGDDQLQHIYGLEADVMEMDELYEQIWKRLIWSTDTALQWGNNYRLSTIASMEAYANNRDGKPQPSKLDFAVCRWINQPVPKIASKVEQPD